MPDWLFHWTHDQVFIDIFKAFITALGPIASGVITWFGIRWTGKLTKQTLENTKEATPPELLRLEKWSTILKDSDEYSEKLKENLDLETISSTYNDVLEWASLESKINKLGILHLEVRNELLRVKPSSGDGTYPNPKWKNHVTKENILGTLSIICLILISICVLIASLYCFVNNIFKPLAIIFAIVSIFFIILFIWALYDVFIKQNDGQYDENNIIFYNAYYALKDVYLLRGNDTVYEGVKEKNGRNRFEKTRNYKKWKKKIEEKGLDWGSWNYGLNIGWDNNPAKAKSNELASGEFNDSTVSGFMQENSGLDS